VDQATQRELIELGKITLPAVITLVGVLGGGYLAHRYARQQARSAKALDFLERRVREFYSPMLGCIRRVKALGELRVEMSQAASAAWREVCERAPKPFLGHETAFKPFEAIIDYENDQLSKDILPAYDRMVTVFTDNYWLADDDTRQHYVDLCRYVEIWHRFKAAAIPRDVLVKVEHSEERLQPLYKTVERKLAEYTQVLADKKSI
jgi:hypothetical protein